MFWYWKNGEERAERRNRQPACERDEVDVVVDVVAEHVELAAEAVAGGEHVVRTSG